MDTRLDCNGSFGCFSQGAFTVFRAFCLGCDHHSSLSDKHSGAYNWADIQPECVIFFFFNSPGCWWVLQWLMFLTLNWTKSKDSSPLNPLMCAVCVYNRSLRFVSFCIYPGICVCFWVLLPLCTRGLRMAIYNGSEEKSLQAFSLKSWSNRAAGALMQQEAKSDKYDQ